MSMLKPISALFGSLVLSMVLPNASKATDLVSIRFDLFSGDEPSSLSNESHPALFELDPRVDRVELSATNPNLSQKPDLGPRTWMPELTPAPPAGEAGRIEITIYPKAGEYLACGLVRFLPATQSGATPSAFRVTSSLDDHALILRTLRLTAPTSSFVPLPGTPSADPFTLRFTATNDYGENGGGPAGFREEPLTLVQGPQITQWAAHTEASSNYYSPDCDLTYCAVQVVGPPDVINPCTGSDRAWSPLEGGNVPQWLHARFSTPTFATGVEIHEVGRDGGFVTRVTVFDNLGNSTVVWEGVDPTPCGETFTVNFPQTSQLINSVLIDTQLEWWEQIDAVKLIGVSPEGDGMEQWASDASASTSYDVYWTASQAEGAPNIESCEDSYFSWVPRTRGIDPEYLEAFFDVPVYATGVRVFETYSAPFVTDVELIDVDGVSHLIWSGTDTTSCPGVFLQTFPQTSYAVKGIRVHTQSPNYEEIDAVQLIGTVLDEECVLGTVNAGNGEIRDVLFVNGSNGGSDRRVEVKEGEPIWVTILRPPGGSNGRFVMNANFGSYDSGNQTALPYQMGTTCFPLFLSDGATPDAIWRNFGRAAIFGRSQYFDGTLIPNPNRAPTTFLDLPEGDAIYLPAGTVVTFQGAIIDRASAGTEIGSATNSVTLKVLPAE